MRTVFLSLVLVGLAAFALPGEAQANARDRVASRSFVNVNVRQRVNVVNRVNVVRQVNVVNRVNVVRVNRVAFVNRVNVVRFNSFAYPRVFAFSSYGYAAPAVVAVDPCDYPVAAVRLRVFGTYGGCCP